ncbi:MAG: hypothetical protein M1829_003840 [Trizodia sp. TS-e1964]|nr:MAG: hypothetical protein M1829_003840 [Trizodia sp. TS-e1964]
MSILVREFQDLALFAKTEAGSRGQAQRQQDSNRPSNPIMSTPANLVSESLPDFSSVETYDIDDNNRSTPPLQQDYTVGFCSEITPDGYYTFQIIPQDRRVAVRIGDKESSYHQPTCSCKDFYHTKTACGHIIWLLDQLAKDPSKDQVDRFVLPPRKTSSSNKTSPFQQISREGLMALAQRRGWPFRYICDMDDAASLQHRKEAVRDILSSMDGERTPEEFDTDLEDLSDVSTDNGNLLAQDGVEANIIRLAVYDDAFFRTLRTAVSADYCAAVYCRRMSITAGNLISALEKSASNNTLDKQDWFREVEDTAGKVRGVVEAILQYFDNHAPLARSTKSLGLQVLCKILYEVCNQTHEPSWATNGASSSDEPTPNQNLYVALINLATSDRPTSTGRFIIDVLPDFEDVARDIVELLDEILSKIDQNGVPRAYRNKLAGFIDRLNLRTAGISIKRTMPQSHDEAKKRMK